MTVPPAATQDHSDGVNRRTFIAIGAMGAASLLAACSASADGQAGAHEMPSPDVGRAPAQAPTTTAAASTSTTVAPGTPPTSGPLPLFAAPDLNLEALFALAGASYGAGEVGEVVATARRINAAGASYQTYFDE
jgi:hypothetical protein